MRHTVLISLCIAGVASLSACQKSSDAEVERALKSINVIDETNLNDVMLTVADPNEAVDYFARALKPDPDRIDLQRGLAKSLVRAKRNTEGVAAWTRVTRMEGSTPDDRVDLADALIRTGDWAKAKKELDSVPPTRRSSATGSRRWWRMPTRNGNAPTAFTRSPPG